MYQGGAEHPTMMPCPSWSVNATQNTSPSSGWQHPRMTFQDHANPNRLIRFTEMACVPLEVVRAVLSGGLLRKVALSLSWWWYCSAMGYFGNLVWDIVVLGLKSTGTPAVDGRKGLLKTQTITKFLLGVCIKSYAICTENGNQMDRWIFFSCYFFFRTLDCCRLYCILA